MTWELLTHSGYLAAFLVGLLGGIHCLGMCGGIVSALTFSLPATQRNSLGNLLPMLLAYNTGRISGYVLAGGLAGGLGAAFLSFAGLESLRHFLQIFAALFMIALGLYLAGIWMGVARIENAGRRLWRHVEPMGRRFMPLDSPGKALPLGFIWGWLPCGLVYSVLIWSLSAASITEGALLMLAFGLGTLPNLLLMGAAAAKLAKFTRNPLVKRIAGLLVVTLGLLLLWQAVR
ncbi:MAG TPA: sulfite exporter TauE/SafE family protein [Candidatus Thiothrix moscowensis]|uniref:sulfite exporter TauE/SafE family protein n=1 Tax=unclassified Thiothrix TaxID=2636184 RepID=UPI0025FE77BD|nr:MULTISPECIES: sulfite exporter TauE/SafE family protein [unclassified Thiothrix]HRJ53464.1 sulfite exporter TauE/SafE family protein [Candidatus Thiothrix moscowensis]HRJ93543.1 sulfite exporter TauE/SafE family protein [Candidatus Thiothrix moscowensis]